MKEVEAQALKQWIDEGKVLLIDVREEDEFKAGRIEGSVFLPLSAFNPHDVPAVEDGKTLVFQCRSGGRSARAAEVYEAFYPDQESYNFVGGILAWEEQGYPIISGE
jgi:rhodanese-related sulfurtransferase